MSDESMKVIFCGLVMWVVAFLSGCTGPFGVVLGGDEIHDSYNERIRIQHGVEQATKKAKQKIGA